MKTGWVRKSLWVFCLVLPAPWTVGAMAESGTPGVLSRVQTVDDPELGELIRVTLDGYERLYGPGNTENEANRVQAVTESYAKIKLLDRQVEQIEGRIKSATGPVELQRELLLAKAELESKRLIELAHLRQVMGIIPRYSLGHKAVWDLRTWLKLDVLDDQVYLVELLRPFPTGTEKQTHKPVGVMSPDQVLRYLDERLQEKDRLPIRVDIDRTLAGVPLSEDLGKKFLDLVKKAGLEMDAEVHLNETVQKRPAELSVSIKAGQTLLSCLIDGRSTAYQIVPPNNTMETIVGALLARPENVPARFVIRYTSWQPAEQVTIAIEDIAKRLGLAKYVEVVQQVGNGRPESLWLGHWRTTAPGRISEVAILRGHTGSLTEKGETHPIRWTLGSDGIVLREGDQTYLGSINAEGSLVLTVDGATIAFQKVE